MNDVASDEITNEWIMLAVKLLMNDGAFGEIAYE